MIALNLDKTIAVHKVLTWNLRRQVHPVFEQIEITQVICIEVLIHFLTPMNLLVDESLQLNRIFRNLLEKKLSVSKFVASYGNTF